METKIQFELKGRDYNETLIWNSPEDIKVKPFIIEMSLQSTCCNTKASEFKICQNIFVFDIEKISRNEHWTRRGADSLRFTIEDDTIDKESF
jgi:methylmalonyl-CoA mutase